MSRLRSATRLDDAGERRPSARGSPGAADVSGVAPLPTFVIIGAQKSATRWLRQNLGRHPDIYIPPRELKYFNHPKRVDVLGTAWYRAQFDGWAGEAIIGEGTPGYMMLGHRPADVARRIQATVPEARLLALLRNPVDRAFSAFLHHKRAERIHPRARLLDTVRRCQPEDDWMGIVAGGWYAASLGPYVELFGDQLLVLIHDDIEQDPQSVYVSALRHVGAPTDFEPPSLDRVVFSHQDGADADNISVAERCELFELFRDDIARLETMLGRDLTMWQPSATPG
jgi:hypothetical protein